MSYLRKKGKYWSLVEGGRDPETGKVRQKVLKYYGAEKPENFQLAKDIAGLGLGTTDGEPAVKPAKKAKVPDTFRGKYPNPKPLCDNTACQVYEDDHCYGSHAARVEHGCEKPRPRSPKLGTTSPKVLYATENELSNYAKICTEVTTSGAGMGVIEHQGGIYVVFGIIALGTTVRKITLYKAIPRDIEPPRNKNHHLLISYKDKEYYFDPHKEIIIRPRTDPPAFDLNTRVSQNNIKTVLGTTWRNKYTHDLFTVCNITENKNRPGEYDLWGIDDTPDDTSLNSANRGEKWKTAMEHWYRVDNLTIEAQTEAFCKRIGYCREEGARSRKKYNRMRMLPAKEQKKDSCFASNLGLRKSEHEWDVSDLEIALKQLEKFKNGGKYEDMYNLPETKERVHVQGDNGKQAPVQQGPCDT